ncbi:MAG: XisI protein [Thiotrichaceae bacterium IS1]|nr:MAG: XisI protein [Thiotrichaceae bacterium IS1]
MANLDYYRTCIEQIITEYSRYQPKYGDIELQIVFDEERDHYQLVSVGWEDDKRVNGLVLQIDIKNGKVWIQRDGTEQGIADELVACGVPKQDIVLAFHPHYARQHTGFAVA